MNDDKPIEETIAEFDEMKRRLALLLAGRGDELEKEMKH